jgi:hypothetical protein
MPASDAAALVAYDRRYVDTVDPEHPPVPMNVREEAIRI